ncbi:DUF6053 domain-containing protein [Lysobacter sp. CA199]|uniref:DUF6053 domain-containing protein n=1 Tax=Lysobacter sp. CA199 TaxID=3455608 RepID=UPI003F8D10D2
MGQGARRVLGPAAAAGSRTGADGAVSALAGIPAFLKGPAFIGEHVLAGRPVLNGTTCCCGRAFRSDAFDRIVANPKKSVGPEGPPTTAQALPQQRRPPTDATSCRLHHAHPPRSPPRR